MIIGEMRIDWIDDLYEVQKFELTISIGDLLYSYIVQYIELKMRIGHCALEKQTKW